MKYVDTDSPLRLGRIAPDATAIDKAVKKLEAGEGFQLECDGKVVGALISPRDLELYLQLLREYEDKVDSEAAEAAKKDGEWVEWEQLKARLSS